MLSLQRKAQARREEGLFVVEGRRELLRCAAAGYRIDSLFICREITPPTEEIERLAQTVPCLRLTKRVYERIAYRDGTEGVSAIVYAKEKTAASLALSACPLVIVAEGVEKPGNIGAILRTADAVAADAAFVCDCPADPYNPNIIRSSTGTVFTVPLVCCSSAEAIEFLKNNKIQILTAQLQDSRPYYEADMRLPTAIVVGNEAQGLSSLWRENADRHIRIPMLGEADSLNVSTSAAVLVYEAIRQRNT